MLLALKQTVLLPPSAPEKYVRRHRVYLAVMVTGMGICLGLLSLLLAAFSYPSLNGFVMMASYLLKPALLALNLLPTVGLMWLFYFLTRRAWAAYLLTALPVMALGLANYYKISLRGDPLLASDLLLASEAGGIVGGYTLEVTPVILAAAALLAAGFLFCRFLMPRSLLRAPARAVGAGVAVLLFALAPWLYGSEAVYAATENNRFINPWSDVEVYVSRGQLYPFLHSAKDMFPTPPEGYDSAAAQALLGQYADGDIPAERQVSVVGVMLEAFCDLTDFPALGAMEGVAEVYRPWHDLEGDSLSGDLLTNIFAGGTVDSEWGFLTGYTQHDDFRKDTDSYVWYFLDQGYDTIFHHPGHGWFYNRQNVNEYLGFGDSWFTENHYGSLVDPTAAIWHSDGVLVQELLLGLDQSNAQGRHSFSFAVSYQNHGPYDTTDNGNPQRVSPAETGWSQESCNIFNNYLQGVSDTIAQMTALVQALEERQEPVVLVLFGDHKPWMGNGNSAYLEAGANFDVSTLEGFYQYYATPYLIWANSAARAVLGGENFRGDGGDFSPCFLMPRLFDACGWEGPAFMQLSRAVREVTPLVHSQGLYLSSGNLTQTLPQEQADFLQQYLWAQFYREKEIVPIEW